MAENNFERQYTIPLRRQIMKVPAYRRSGRAVKAIKQFIAKHMKVADRDVDKVKLDVDFNNEVWLRGKTNPPTKVTVKATKQGDLVHVTFVEMPARVKFNKEKNARFHRGADKQSPVAEVSKPELSNSEKKEEKEKEAAVAESAQKEAKADAKAKKHTTKVDKHDKQETKIPKK
jgi:large subunit ribosomal protein L31e